MSGFDEESKFIDRKAEQSNVSLNRCADSRLGHSRLQLQPLVSDHTLLEPKTRQGRIFGHCTILCWTQGMQRSKLMWGMYPPFLWKKIKDSSNICVALKNDSLWMDVETTPSDLSQANLQATRHV